MRLQQTLKQHHYIVTTSKNTSNESGKQSKKVGNVMVSNHLEHQTVGIDSAGSCSRGGGSSFVFWGTWICTCWDGVVGCLAFVECAALLAMHYE